ncbi:class I SAM-dependent methyltransferase [Paenibacillus methanolicus]|uniref:Putative SAM-dependent methyltransferase n=1 Tax=Paenibacillus methanolicus TaxID=582686 RepID=A0A5S5BZG1_9BACL|nr:class I SAM-dependent methyltransferase [Paenibacillus methanolicus]TYP72571.1 putative SAM-dependent methyltransferase [Paenibacillus methanolicus]
MIVTTPQKPSPELVKAAQRLSEELGGCFVPRRQETLTGLRKKHGDENLLVVDPQGLRYYDNADQPLYFHPSMAYVRVKRLRKGERDPLVDISGCEHGDTIVDCTAGLGSDALVFAYASGSAGKVIAIESEPVLCAVVREGLKTYVTAHEDVNAAMRRIEMRAGNHRAFLEQLPDKSVDIVYFDPMFRQPVHESSALAPLRSLANRDALDEETIRQAVRVARKSVVMKEHAGSGEFERLGFDCAHVNKIAYGVIKPT